MTWLIFALGAVLSLAGAISIASGIPYIRIEWGWTEVIAGATALSGGVVTFALGAVLLRLSALQRTMRERGLGLLPSDEPDARSRGTSETFDQSEGDDEVVQPMLEPLEPATFGRRAAAASVEHAPTSADAPGRLDAAAEPRATDLDVTPSVLDTDADEAAEAVPLLEAEARRRVPWTARLKARFRKTRERGSVAEAEPSFEFLPSSDAAPADAGMAPSLDLPGHAPGSSGLLGDDRGGAPEEASIRDGSSQGPAFQAQGADGEAPFHRVGVDDIATAPTIVGRYDAGGASYVLLSDGAIEVKTDTGVHRFASMQDLKAFIEAQERQNSGGA